VPIDPFGKDSRLMTLSLSIVKLKDFYGGKGNVSVRHPCITIDDASFDFNIMFRSERELMNTLPMRLDWLWFLDYDLDSEIRTIAC